MGEYLERKKLKHQTTHLNCSLVELKKHCNQPPFNQLIDYIGINQLQDQPLSFDLFNVLFQSKLESASVDISFVDQTCLDNTNLPYEQFIFQNKQIPSRANWHDFFNAAIWSQFPLTKNVFNELHVGQIKTEGYKTRTAIRDKLTHFDECGLVVFTNNSQYQIDCANHHWHTLFVKNQPAWGTTMLPVIFGHAIWEMLLHPYIGLTGKVRFIEVSTPTLNTLRHNIYDKRNYHIADQLLMEYLLQNTVLTEKKPWLPLPILGIPNWSIFTQNDDFYANTNYFMPLRKKRQD